MLVFKNPTDRGQRIPDQPGQSVLAALACAGIAIAAPCGGGGRCGKCKLHIQTQYPFTAQELSLLTPQERSTGIRLACCVPAAQADRVELPHREQAQIVTEGQPQREMEAPAFSLIEIPVPPASITDQRSDELRICAAAHLALSPAALLALPDALVQSPQRLWALCQDQSIVQVFAHPVRPLALSFDIGTTTIAGYLTDAQTGAVLRQQGQLNAQHSFGADVISRAQHAQTPQGLAALRTCIRRQLSDMAVSLLQHDDPTAVAGVSIAGNPVMLHLLLGVSPAGITRAPFAPVFSDAKYLPAPLLDLPFAQAQVRLLPGISGYVGADTVAAVLSSGLHKTDQLSLLLDIGTNGEIVLGDRTGLRACSAAAGPAFEGAHIACGMAGVAGAICRVWLLDGALRFDTIGGIAPAGICGSGLIDAVCALLALGIIDESGAMLEEAPGVAWEEDELRYYLAPGVYLTQSDIRQVQLAKAAIAAGVFVLLKEAGKTPAQLQRVYLAGGFGSHLNPQSAMQLGLLPSVPSERIVLLGNAAGAGARQALLDRSAWAQCAEIAKMTDYIELSLRRDFSDLFVEQMMF